MSIKLIMMDVDGVLTDGSIVIDSRGVESKIFNVRDGAGIYTAIKAGLRIVWVSGRSSDVTLRRAAELGVRDVYQVKGDKIVVYDEVKDKMGFKDDEIAYIGDDLLDIPPMIACGLPMAPADAVEEVKKVARYVSPFPGGKGCVRDCIEYILKDLGLFDGIINSYMSP